MTWTFLKPSADLLFDGGVTATDQRAVDVERRLRFANGSGDDLVDAVGLSLDCADHARYEATSEFGDPLELLMLEEEEEDDMN